MTKLFFTLLFISLNSNAQPIATTPEPKPLPASSTTPSLTTPQFEKSFEVREQILFERKHQYMFEFLIGPFSFSEYDDQLESSSEFGIGSYSFSETGNWATGLNFILGTSEVKDTFGNKLDGEYIEVLQEFLRRYRLSNTFSLAASLGVGFIVGDVNNISPDKNYWRMISDQKLALMIRILGNTAHPLSEAGFLSLGVKNLYVFNEPTVKDAGYGSNLGLFVNFSFIGNTWLPVGSN